LWGFIPVFRGTVSRDTFTTSESILSQKGILAIFPEGGNWANVLRPARPGVAFLAVRTGAPIIPVGFDGLEGFLPRLKQGKRSTITVRIGKSIGPFKLDVRGRENRAKLDDLGHEIMSSISELIPHEKRGFYSADPLIREAARGTEIYPWDDIQEA
jgi:1-acyl-sn-glycerol-3-phosphate acyltransferase